MAESILERLNEEIKPSPIIYQEENVPKHKILADGYERQTKKQTMYKTIKYKRRKLYLFIRVIILLLALAGLIYAIFKLGLLEI